MKKTLAIATFVVAGVGAAAAGAASLPNFNGSDTLGRVTLEEVGPKLGTQVAPYTTQIFAAPIPPWLAVGGSGPLCAGATTLEYLGGGSGGGEAAMTTNPPTQDLAPMSRFLQGTPIETGVAATTTCLVANGSKADGIVIGLDGLAIAASAVTATTTACNGPANSTQCTPTPASAVFGLAYDGANATGGVNVTATQRQGQIPPGGTAVQSWPGIPAATAATFPNFTFASWHDVLDILYAGFVDPALHPTDPEKGKNCASSLRFALANNYSDIFESPACTAGACTSIQHIFRRDDASGTSDIFGALLNLSPSAAYNKNNNATLGYFLGADPFCNDMVNNTLSGASINGVAAAGDAIAAWGTVPPGVNPPSTTGNGDVATVPNDDQDYDAIRRPCIGGNFAKAGEQVCEGATFDRLNPTCTGTGAGTCPINPQDGAQEQCLGGQCWDTNGTLGLLLPVITTNTIGTDQANPALNDQYNILTTSGTPTTTNGCCSNLQKINQCTHFNQFSPPPVLNGKKVQDGLCPNGDTSVPAGNTCWIPVDANENPNCWGNAPAQNVNGNGNQYTFVGATGAAIATNGGPPVNTVDGRVYNLYSWGFVGGAFQVNVDDSNRPLTGAYFRIHTSSSLLANSLGSCSTAAGTAVCALNDATDQIGCLVQASPCSIGYAGRHASLAFGPGNAVVSGKNTAVCTQGGGAFNVKAIPDATACITNFAYPYSRKLYLNAASGFAPLGAAGLNANQSAEAALAACESTESNISQPLTFEGFIPLPAGSPNNGNPFCEDFNEFQLCGSPLSGVTSNANACASNPTGLPNATNSTTCGNGIVETFEDCDQGTAGLNNDGTVVQLATAVAGSPTTFANGFPGSACSNACRFTK